MYYFLIVLVLFFSLNCNLVITGCFHVNIGHAVVKIVRVKATPKSLIKKIRGKEVEKEIEKSGLALHLVVAVGKKINIFFIILKIKGKIISTFCFYYSYITVPQIVAQDHHLQVVEVVPDQALHLVLLLLVRQVLLGALEIEEENEVEAKVLMLHVDMIIKKKKEKKKEKEKETGTEIEIEIEKKIKKRVVIL